MKLIFKILLKFRSNDEGFAIPIVMALGLLMIFIGILGMFKSNEEEIAAISQRNRAKALAAAEKGINDYRLLLDRNKRLALYDQTNHTSTTTGWRTSGIPLCENKNNITSAINNGSFITINGNDRFGQYRLIEYTYNQTDGTEPTASSEGQLTIEGKSGTATARLQVDIPIQPTTAQRNIIPALWLNDTTTTDLTGVTLGDSSYKGDILISVANQNTSTGTSACDSASPTGFNRSSTFFYQSDNQSLIIEPIAIGSIDSNITTTVNSKTMTVVSDDLNNKLPVYYSTPLNATLPASFPSNASANAASKTISDAKGSGSDNIYYYKTPANTNLSITGNLNIQNNTKVVLYVDGNLTFDSSSNDIGLAQKAELGATNTNTSAYLEIYVIGNRTIKFKGNNKIDIKGFIHAPTSSVQIEDNPTIKIVGALWAKNLKRNSGATGTMNILADTYNSSTTSNIPAFVNYSSAKNVLIPTISPPDQWRTQEVR
jgi:hypothetical protein